MSKNKPLDGCQTVGELIVELQKFDLSLLVVGAYEGWIRENEYYSIQPQLDNLDNQNTSGDPEFYGKQACVVLK